LNLLAIPYPHQNEQNWAGIEIHWPTHPHFFPPHHHQHHHQSIQPFFWWQNFTSLCDLQLPCSGLHFPAFPGADTKSHQWNVSRGKGSAIQERCPLSCWSWFGHAGELTSKETAVQREKENFLHSFTAHYLWKEYEVSAGPNPLVGETSTKHPM
jgi:hypothetical protein